MKSRLASFFVACVTLVGGGAFYKGLAEDSQSLEEAMARISSAPFEAGEWKAQLVSEDESEQAAFEQAGARAHWTRTYTNQRTKASVLAILMGGRPGKMAVHTPEVCYRGAGYELSEAPSVCTIKNELGDELYQFWMGQFTKKAGQTTGFRLYWAWNSRGTWEPSSNPRWHFRGEPYLFKLYVSRDLNHQPFVAPQSDPAADFLKQMLPTLKASLFPDQAT